jgi:YD repeat-containing protein
MSVFVKFEEEVIDKLVSSALTPDLISSLKQDGSLVSYEYDGYGYFLTVAHPLLPKTRIVCGEPVVTGTSGGIRAGFVIFIENHELTFDAFPLGDFVLPPNFRESKVHISQLDNPSERVQLQ